MSTDLLAGFTKGLCSDMPVRQFCPIWFGALVPTRVGIGSFNVRNCGHIKTQVRLLLPRLTVQLIVFYFFIGILNNMVKTRMVL